MRIRKEKDFFSCFDEKNGNYIRSGIIEDGKDTGVDPFMASFPELLDIGIMGHCIHGKSGLCMKAGIECYQDGLHSDKKNMKLEDFRIIAEQCKGKTYQFALGGCGDPDQHENFEEILKICSENLIVPNFTSSGLGFNNKIADLCKKYCGAVAVSWYRSEYTLRAIRLLLENGIKTNIHYVLSKNTIDEAIDMLKADRFPEGINAVIFLLHKPVGLGRLENVLTANDMQVRDFFTLVDKKEFSFKIGFDSCSVPGLLQYCENINWESIDTCEGARWSAYITADMKMLPCSFDNQDMHWSVDLRKYNIQQAWDSVVFENFRNKFRHACPKCKDKEKCMGGCPICPSIVLCTEKRNIS